MLVDRPACWPRIGFATRSQIMDEAYDAVCFGNTASYVHALAEHGGAPLMIPSVRSVPVLDRLYTVLDGLLLTGGPDINPAAYGEERHARTDAGDAQLEYAEFYLLRRALADGLPVLGICRGLQTLNVALGGTLYQDLEHQRGGAAVHPPYGPDRYEALAHPVQVSEASHLHRAAGCTEILVNSLHHQGVRDLAPGLVATALAPDGLIEAAELQASPFVVAVQWHPEELYQNNAAWAALFRAFIAAASEHARGKH